MASTAAASPRSGARASPAPQHPPLPHPSSPLHSQTLTLKDSKKKRGVITVTAEEVKQSNGFVTLDLSGQKLDKKDLFGGEGRKTLHHATHTL